MSMNSDTGTDKNVPDINTYGLTDLGYKIFLDRYALKDLDRSSLQVGDTVIAVLNDSKDMSGKREVSIITSLNEDGTATILTQAGDELNLRTEYLDKPLEINPTQLHQRVSKGVASVEVGDKQEEWSQKFEWLMDDWKFIPGGRILTMAGSGHNLSAFNCFVIGMPKDSRAGIIDTLEEMAEIMSRGGGVGINVSSLRPKNSYVKGVNGRSSGAVSFGALYSFMTGLISQAGCFAPDTRISTNKGLIPAEELTQRIENGERFYAHTHKGLREITAKFRNGSKQVFRLTTKRGYTVNVTEDHKIGVLTDGQIVTMPLKYLQANDEILLSTGNGFATEYVQLQHTDHQRTGHQINQHADRRIRQPDMLDEELAYLLGYSFGDGYVHAEKALKLATADEYQSIRERLINASKNVFDIIPVIENGDGAVKSVALYSIELIEWLSINGLLKQKSAHIEVPEAIYRSPSSVVSAFVSGYFDADGCNRGKKAGYGIDSISLSMLSGIQMLLSSHGIISTIRTQERQDGWQTIYRLSITGSIYQQRFASWSSAIKVSPIDGKRSMYHTYPADVLNGVKSKYRQRIYDGVSNRVSISQISAIAEKASYEDIETSNRLMEFTNVMTDTIISIEALNQVETFDFEVDDVHMLSGNGIYTSNSRRGALMLILNDNHPDILNFIDSKKTAGNITNANISVGISDRFMDAVKADQDWDLIFPDTSYEGYDAEWDGNIEKWQAQDKPVIIYRTVKAREMWMKIIESAWSSAEPGLWFRDHANKMSNSYYYDNGYLICTNPCVTGDTLINTSLGIKTMQELYDTQVEFSVVTDSRFGTDTLQQSSQVFATGVKPVYRLVTSDGYTLKATDNHQIMTSTGWRELGKLKQGDRIHTLNRKGSFGIEGNIKLGRVIGWLVGDGYFSDSRAGLSFYGEKMELAPIFSEYVDEIANNEVSSGYRQQYSVGIIDQPTHNRSNIKSVRLQRVMDKYGLLENKLQVPDIVFNGNEEMQRGYLQGLFSADGSVQGNLEKGVSIRLTSISTSLLEQVQIVLSNFGIKSTIYKFRKMAGLKSMPDGQGGQKDYECQALHELVVAKSNIDIFINEIGFLQSSKNSKLAELTASRKRATYRESFTAVVESITYVGDEMVYDLQQPTTHSFIANGLVVHNCGEQSLSANAVCNLGAINLSKFSLLGDFIPQNEIELESALEAIDWNALSMVTRYAIRFLDDVIDHTYYVTEANKEQEQGERRVGLGIMGLAELMVRIGIRYGSEDSIEFIERIMHFIARESYISSAEIAEEKGSFKWFDAENFLNSGFMQNMDQDVKDIIREKGIRNVTLNTIAPTGTTSTMVETSGGIEPYFSFVFFRQGRLGVHEQRVELAEKWVQTYGSEENQELPSFFVTAMDLPPEEHVRTMAAAQKWVDSSISKTCNVPNDYTIEQTEQLYMQMYDLGCKGGTIYRDGSRNEQVLHLENPEEKKDVAVQSLPEPVTATHETAQDFSTRNKRRPSLLNGVTFQVATPYATNAYVTVNEDENRYPYEVFITVGKAGSDLQAQAESIGRLISKSIQIMPPYLRFDGLREIVLQLVGIGGNRSTGFGPNQVRSLPDAIGSSIIKMYIDKRDIALQAQEQIEKVSSLGLSNLSDTVTATNVSTNLFATVNLNGNGNSSHAVNGVNAYNNNTRPAIKSLDKASAMTEMCPECQNYTLLREEGCKHCHNCGYSEC